MKRLVIFLSMAGLVLAFGSCKPKKSHYRQVYEQAKQREIADINNSTAAPQADDDAIITSKQAEPVISVRKERLTPVSGEESGRLKQYSVVIGSFQNRTNAYSLKERMEGEGYYPVLAENEAGMLRVIISSFNTREEAVSSREEIKARFSPLFQDAWLLERDR